MSRARIIVLHLSILFMACGGGGGGDMSALALLGLGGNEPVSPSDPPVGASTEPAPAAIADPVLTELELALGLQAGAQITCEGQLPYNASEWDRQSYGVCVYGQPAGSEALVYPTEIGKPVDETITAACQARPNGRFSTESHPPLIAYAEEQCDFAIAAPPPAVVTPEPVPADPPQLMSVADWAWGDGLMGDTPDYGRVYPEARSVTLSFDRNICPPYTTDATHLVQLWKKDNAGQWAKVPAQIRCAQHEIKALPGTELPEGNLSPGMSDFYKPTLPDAPLDQLYFEPDSEYRLLVSDQVQAWHAIKGYHGDKLEPFNDGGTELGVGANWSALDFSTRDAPCFVSYADRYQLHNGEGSRYLIHACNLAVQRIDAIDQLATATALFTGPAMVGNPNPPDNHCDDPALFSYDSSVYTPSYHTGWGVGPITYNIALAEMLGIESDTGLVAANAMCIENAGKPEEFVRYYFRGAPAFTPADCKGIPVDLSGFQTEVSEHVYNETSFSYDRRRVAGCPDRDREEPPEPPIGQCQPGVSFSTSSGRWFATPEEALLDANGKKFKTGGVHTFWDHETIKLRINVCQSGYYRLRLFARNIYGPLPEFYGAYHLNLINERDGKVYGASIPSSEDRYKASSTLVYLEAGQNEMRAEWVNDAYLQNVYDANIQLQRAAIVAVPGTPAALSSLSRKGRDFCQMDGRYYAKGSSVFVEVAGKAVHYCFPDLPAGRYRIILNSQARGPVPEGFQSFDVSVSNGGLALGVIQSKASEQKSNAYLDFDHYGGDARLAFAWSNAPQAGEAAFQLNQLRLKSLGAAGGTALGAYLRGGTQSTALVLLALSLAAIFAIGLYRLRFRRQPD